MFDKIIQLSLKHRTLVIALSAFVFVYGLWIITRLPVDVLPDLNKPNLTIMTESEGLAPEEVEKLVTKPLENALVGISSLERIRSTSGIGLSIIYLELSWDAKINEVRQLVTEKLNLAQNFLPKNTHVQISPISSIMGEIMLLGVSSKDGSLSPTDLRTIADWNLKPALLSISGVSQVIPMGGGVKQYQILVRPEKLRHLKITLHDIEKALEESSLNTTGGFVDAYHQEFLVRILGRVENIEDLKKTVVTQRNGVSITIGQIAEVKEGNAIKRGETSVNGAPAVILNIQKQPGANTVDLTKQILEKMEKLKKTLPASLEIKPIFKQANFITASLHNVKDALRDGTIMVVIVLSLFLLNFRTTAITLTAIPLSFVLTGIIFHFFNISVNTMTLGGLAIAIGELVDDAIVDVENIFRRLKENRQKETPAPSLQVVLEASKEVRNSIVFATLIVVLVFIPLFALSGIEGRLFLPLGLSYIISILASLLVSLTLTPALSSYLLPKAKMLAEKKESFLVRFLKKRESLVLEKVFSSPKKTLASVAGLFLLALLTIPFLGNEFLPPFNEGTATINVLALPGTSLEESDKMGNLVEKTLLTIPEVASTGRRTGRAEQDEHAAGVNYSEIDVDFKKSKRSQPEVLKEIREKLSLIPGLIINIGQPISHRLDHLLSGVRAQIAIKIFGDDLHVLRDEAEKMKESLSHVKGLVDLHVESQVFVPQIQIRINRDKAKKYGIQAGEVASHLQTASYGRVISSIIEGEASFDVLLRVDDFYRNSVTAFENMLIETPAGKLIPLSYVAEVFNSSGPNSINRENGKRRIVISANTEGRDLGSVVSDIQKILQNETHLPKGYSLILGGQFESQRNATNLILVLSLFSLCAMILILYSHFRSTLIVIQILVNIPLALIGSVAAIWVSTQTFSVASLIGFITLCGIASRNSIMMISHYIHLVKHEGEVFGKHMIIRGTLERLVPVLMTSLTAGLALIPLVLNPHSAGKEILYPVACVILGGLVSSTLLDMIVTPTLFYLYGKRALEEQKIIKSS